MKNKITVSAPGKLMLFGEHAVVYNRPCLVTALDQRMFATVQKLDAHDFILDAPDVNVVSYKKQLKTLGRGDIPKGAQFVEFGCQNFFKKYKVRGGIYIKTKAQFFPKYGFGSSSASTVCLIKALFHLFGLAFSQKDIFDISYKTVLDIQKKGSGFDIASAVYGGILYFVTGGKVIQPLKIDRLPLVVGYSGRKADTAVLMRQVSEKAAKYPNVIDGIYMQIEVIVELAKKALLKKDWERLGELMSINQGYLESLGVGTDMLSAMIYASRNAGAYGAKLSGAGGGDCMIAICSPIYKKNVVAAIEKSGGTVISCNFNAQGVRIEL